MAKAIKRNANSTSPNERPNDAENPTNMGASTRSNRENIVKPCAVNNRQEYTPQQMLEASQGGVRDPQTHIGTHKHSIAMEPGHSSHLPYGMYPNPSSAPNAALGLQ